MTSRSHLLVIAALVFSSTPSMGQFVKGNDAVKVSAGGAKQIETPPLTGAAGRTRPCAAEAGCHPGPWYRVEINTGLVECTEPFARPGTCRASTYGARKLSRVWVAKHGATWVWCQFPDLGSKCADMNARPPLNLPTSAVQ
jgi:hypothetical protein